jgi:hypothetical protein
MSARLIPIAGRVLIGVMGAVAAVLGGVLIRPGANKRDEESRKTGADYMGEHTGSPYKGSGEPRQTVGGRSELKGSW